MYKILDESERERLTFEEITKKYKGKWVYIVDTQGLMFGMFESGIVAVVADKELEGRETGIYRQLDLEYNGRTISWGWWNLPDTINLFGFTEVSIDGL
ncbi:MAG: hypothetical protein FWG68_10405 [Defluviitaleaceae bacterium]|nr:hypothetical protein [Defluviitaleaceae bacterium]